MKEIKRCPSCGGKARFIQMGITKGIKLGFVKCTECGLRLEQENCTEDFAIDKWNTRVPMERIIERLEENCFWTSSTFDEDGYCNDDSEEVVGLYKAIEIIKEEGGIE